MLKEKHKTLKPNDGDIYDNTKDKENREQAGRTEGRSETGRKGTGRTVESERRRRYTVRLNSVLQEKFKKVTKIAEYIPIDYYNVTVEYMQERVGKLRLGFTTIIDDKPAIGIVDNITPKLRLEYLTNELRKDVISSFKTEYNTDFVNTLKNLTVDQFTNFLLLHEYRHTQQINKRNSWEDFRTEYEKNSLKFEVDASKYALEQLGLLKPDTKSNTNATSNATSNQTASLPDTASDRQAFSFLYNTIQKIRPKAKEEASILYRMANALSQASGKSIASYLGKIHFTPSLDQNGIVRSYAQFIGEKGALNLSSEVKAAYIKAIDMKKLNIDANSIFKETGWIQDQEKNWYYEIEDRREFFDFPFSRNFIKNIIHTQINSATVLGDIYNNIKLYKAYPELRDISVVYDSNLTNVAFFDAYGIYKSTKNVLYL